MTAKSTIDGRRYYADIRKKLQCSAKERRKITEQIRHSVDDYIEQNPECTFEDIVRHFGSADEISQMYLSIEDSAKISTRMKNKKVQRNILITIAIAIIIIAITISACIIWNQSSQLDNGYIVSEVPKQSNYIKR